MTVHLTTVHYFSCENPKSRAKSASALPIVGLALSILLTTILATASSAQVVDNVYNFTGTNSSAYPGAVTPAQGRNGALYGTTSGQQSGTNYGSIFELRPTGGFRQLFTFDSTRGAVPGGGLTLGGDGNFYGTASIGGSTNNGVLFKMSADGSYTVLHEFAGGGDGAIPSEPPIIASDGNLYGATKGNATTTSTIYKYSRSTGILSTLYQFDSTHGSNVLAPPIQAADGNLYGVAESGAANGCGSIFKLSRSGTLLWFYSFPCAPGGANPIGPLIQGTDGNFYGTTSQGGNVGGTGVGTVFRLDKKGVVSVLYNFQGFGGGGTDGSTPEGGLVEATDGKLYGVTLAGGSANEGTLFQVTTGGSYRQLYAFVNKGEFPVVALMQHTNGLLYGTTLEGGTFNFGVVYSLNMNLAPFVALVSYAGKPGGAAQILGQGFTGTSSVAFNGVAATSFKVVSDTYLTAVVPSGATTGPVVVTTPTGKLTSNKNFRVVGTGITAKSKQASLHEPQKSR